MLVKSRTILKIPVTTLAVGHFRRRCELEEGGLLGMEGTEQGQVVLSARRTKTEDPHIQVGTYETSGLTFNQRMIETP